MDTKSPGRIASQPRRLAIRIVAAIVATAATSASAAITGTIRDRQSSERLASKVAAAYTPAGFLEATSTTNSQGKFTLNVPPGSYRVLAFDQQGVYATSYGNDAESFETSPIVSSDATADFTLTRAGFASGQVLQGTFPLRNASVEAYNLSGTRRGFTNTDPNGSFNLVLPPGEYKFVAYLGTTHAPQFFSARSSFGEADQVTVIAGQTAPLGFTLDLAARFSGVVTDVAGLPLAQKEVFAYTPAGSVVISTTTDGAGNFSLTLSPGAYRFVAADPNSDYANDFIEDAQSFDRSPILVLTPGQTRTASFMLERGGRVTGRVIDGSTGQPVFGVTLAAYNLDGALRTAVKTDANGTYNLTLPGREYKIAAFDDRLIYAAEFFDNRRDFASAARVAVVVGTAVGLPDMALDRGTQVGGTVTDQRTGAPVAGITVAAHDTPGNLISMATTNRQGTYALVVVPGTYKFLAFDSELRYAISYAGGSTFEMTPPRLISNGSFEQLNFSVTPGVVVTGTVREVSGAELSDIEVAALDVNGNRVISSRSVDGGFNVVLAPGNYKFMAFDPAQRYQTVFFRGFDVSSAEVVVVSGTNSPTISFTLMTFQRRRAARH